MAPYALERPVEDIAILLKEPSRRTKQCNSISEFRLIQMEASGQPSPMPLRCGVVQMGRAAVGGGRTRLLIGGPAMATRGGCHRRYLGIGLMYSRIISMSPVFTSQKSAPMTNMSQA